jgi:hypothetical protein
MSLRERIGIVLGAIGALALVLYPLAHRLSTEGTAASTGDPLIVVAQRTPTPTPSPSVERTLRSLPATFGPNDRPDWSANAMAHRGADGEAFAYDCSPDGVFGPIWGTDVYTDDTSVCTAGVHHQGMISREEGGTVTIVIRPGRSSYAASTRNGVTSASWAVWEGSYVVVAPSASPTSGG